MSRVNNGTEAFYLYDALGSAERMTDSSGNTLDTYVYDFDGNLTAGGAVVNNPVRFVGRSGYYHDTETDSYYVRARYYTASPSMFLSDDPFPRADGTETPYGYCANDPINMIDPAGTQSYPIEIPGDKYPPFFANPLGSPGACAKPAYLNWTEGNVPIGGDPDGNFGQGEGTLWGVVEIPDSCCATNGPAEIGVIRVYYSTLSRNLTLDTKGGLKINYGELLCNRTAEDELNKDYDLSFSLDTKKCHIAPAMPNVVRGLNVDAPAKPDDCTHFQFAVHCAISCSVPYDPCKCPQGSCSMPAGSVSLAYIPKKGAAAPNETGSVAWSAKFNNLTECKTTPCSTNVTITELGRGRKPRTSS